MDEAAKLHKKLLAMNEALLLGSLRQHELTEAAEKLNEQLRAEITERKRVESELKKATAVAEKANLAKSEFLSKMSHELRTPLNSILGFAQLMEGSTPPPTASQKARLDEILRAGWYLLELINEILDLAAIDSGTPSLSLESVPLAETMRECQAMMEPLAQAHGIAMTFPKFDVPCYVNADRTRLKQVLLNLLSNAIKYNQERGTIVVDCSARSPIRTLVSITNTGAGLPTEKLAQLFQPFNRLGQETGAKEGTGIGLVVAKQLVELMGGAISAESSVGAGSVFRIELNSAAKPESALDKFNPADAALRSQDNKPRRTVLYVEGNPASLELVEQLIDARPNMRLLSAGNGSLAVKLARAHLPEVIFMDIDLPGISGIEALEILRTDPATAHIPVIALSANATQRDIEKGMEAGPLRYLTKPIRVSEFMDALDAALAVSETGAANKK
jgi:signal transduction histidine kinase/CheY-like chemotaxis protein